MASDLTISLFAGKIAVDPAPRAVVEALTQAQVTIAAKGGPSGFDLTFATSTDSLITTQLLPSGYFDPPTRVVLAATLRGATSVLIDGVITHQEVVPSDEAGKSVLSVKGEDLTRMMDLVDLSGFPFPAIAAEVRVLAMLAKYTALYHVAPLVIPSVLLDVPVPLQKIPVQRGTDLAYIKTLADRVGYVFFLQPGPLPGMSVAYWGPMLRVSIPFLPSPPPIAIDWDGRSNVESLQFGFDGFSATQFVILIQAPGVALPVPVPVPGITPISPPLGAKQPMPLKISPLTGLAKYNPVEAAAIGLARASDAANIVSGQGTLDVLRYGAILPARTIVEVRGAGITYDGQYFVESTTHTIKPGSYKQSFTLSRNALIAGSGLPGDVISYLSSPVQQLGTLAGSAGASVGQPPAASQLPGASLLPGSPLSGGATVVPSLPASPPS